MAPTSESPLQKHPGGYYGSTMRMRHSRVLRRKESGGSATNGFAISSVAFVRRSHWQVRRGRLSLAPDSCPENRRNNDEQSCHGESHDPSGRDAQESRYKE